LPAPRVELRPIAILDVAEATQLQRQLQQLAQRGVVSVREARPQRVHELLVGADVLALAPSFGGVAEHVQRRSAQAAQRREKREGA
jgi:cystathionine beta-lyase/cystathionine gamma-synthase